MSYHDTKEEEGRKIYVCLQQFSSRRNSILGKEQFLTSLLTMSSTKTIDWKFILFFPRIIIIVCAMATKFGTWKGKKQKKTQCGMRVPSVEPGVIPGRRRRRRRRRIHADHLLGKTFPLLPPPYYKQTAWNNPNCSGLWSFAPAVRNRKNAKKKKKDERGWQVPEMYVLSVTAAMSTVTIGECKVKDAKGRGGCEYRRSLACPLTTTTSSNLTG
jgi:hypothetical protein